MLIKEDVLQDEHIFQLLREHLDEMAVHSPPESIHALDLDGLRAPDMTFWSIWDAHELVGCGALKDLGEHQGEIKSMRTVAQHRGRGVGQAMLQHIIKEANNRGYRRLSLETGAMSAFSPAHRLYKRYGFVQCEPFANYEEDPNSIFMTRVFDSKS